MKLIAYYRVSTQRQGRSGLGLDAQREIVETFARDRGHELIDEVIEVQSGKDTSREGLARALHSARAYRAGIIVAKLDRLARNASFFDTIARSGVDVLFCNLPDIQPGAVARFLVQVMAQVAELEAGLIGERTKQALAQAKARGTVLGGFRGVAASPKAREESARVRAAAADQKAVAVFQIITSLGLANEDPSAIARELTARRVCRPAGGTVWNPDAVRRCIERARAALQQRFDANFGMSGAADRIGAVEQ